MHFFAVISLVALLVNPSTAVETTETRDYDNSSPADQLKAMDAADFARVKAKSANWSPDDFRRETRAISSKKIRHEQSLIHGYDSMGKPIFPILESHEELQHRRLSNKMIYYIQRAYDADPVDFFTAHQKALSHLRDASLDLFRARVHAVYQNALRKKYQSSKGVAEDMDRTNAKLLQERHRPRHAVDEARKRHLQRKADFLLGKLQGSATLDPDDSAPGD